MQNGIFLYQDQTTATSVTGQKQEQNGMNPSQSLSATSQPKESKNASFSIRSPPHGKMIESHLEGTAQDVVPREGTAQHVDADYGIRTFHRQKPDAGEPTEMSSCGKPPLKLSLKMIESMYDLPQKAAARKCGISLTTLKRACHKLGINQWRATKVIVGLLPPCPLNCLPQVKYSHYTDPVVCACVGV